MAQFVTHIQPTLLEASQGHMPHHHGHQVGLQHQSHLPHSGHNMPSPPFHNHCHNQYIQQQNTHLLNKQHNNQQLHHLRENLTQGVFWGDGNTSFLRSARAGNLEKVLEHLKNNIDINTCNTNGLNALHLASKDGHVHVVSELLKRGALVDSATKKGNTALHIASLAGQEEVVKLLLQSSASVNVQSQNGFTPLYMAAQENHDSVVKLLLTNGANQSLATEDGFTPLAVAMQQGHDKVVAVLLESDTRGKVRLPALHIAAKKDDVKAANLLLENDHNPDITSKSGFTPLHIASHYGNQAIANLLIQKGADVNYLAKHNISPLHVAAKWGKTVMVSLLLEKGANIDAKTRDGLTPLHCAARSGHEQVVDMLLERGAPISAKTKNGLAPLHMAAQGEHVDAARILLYHRAPVDEVTVDYLTALHVAAHCGHVRVAKLLLDRNADANARALNGFTPLHIACKKNRIKVVELLLRHGASISATTESGLTPLHVASFMGCMNIVIYLLQHDASPDVPTVRGETPLHLAARANQTDIIRILLRNGAQVDARAREQQTPLHIASRLGNVDIVMLLLQHGAQVDATTKDMYTALHIAAKEGQDEVAAILIENGAALDSSTKKGFTPLHLAAKYGHMKVAYHLLQKNADVDAQGKNGVTPLHVACHYDKQNVALLLLERGASPHAPAKNGHTPLHIAAKKNQMDIATTLLEYGAHANTESKAGFTPLHLSSQEGHAEISGLLIDHKSNCNHAAKNGLTPMHLCAQEDNVNVAELIYKNGANIEMITKAGYTPLHVAAHFGQSNMVRFLLQKSCNVDASTAIGYTPLHQAAQQGHCHIVNLLLEHSANANAQTVNGQTPLHIAKKLGYISVLDSLKSITNEEDNDFNDQCEDKYRVVAPEAMHETFMSDSEEEGGEDNALSDQPYRYLTVDEMKSLGDDSLPIDVTRDERMDSNRLTQSIENAPKPAVEEIISPNKEPEDFLPRRSIDETNIFTKDVIHTGRKLQWKNFLVSFLVDARGGAMRGCRHSGVKIIIPSRSTCQPTRITCRYVKPQRTMHPPQLMEGEALASRVLELGPISVKFQGPIVMEVPHFASLRGKEREIIILRSDNGETWREHTIENSEDILQDVLNECFETDEINQLNEKTSGHVCRFVTFDFPQYFAVVSRIRQEVHAIGSEGGMVSSTVVPQVQAVFPQGALTKKIKVGLQAQPVDPDLTAKLLGRGVAVSPIVTVEPRRRKFHKAITLSMPAPKAHSQGMINQYSGNTPTLRLLCSITGGASRAQWEDVTGSTPLTFVNDCVSFTTTVSARFWLMDCRNISEATKMATELYREVIHVPFMAKFVVYAKRVETNEAKLRVFCITDDKENKTLENQEQFTEVAKSRDVEVLEGKHQYIEMAGNLVPVKKTGEQLQLVFKAFRENRLPFIVRVKDQHADIVGRTLFMKEPKIAKGEPPQHPICILNIILPEIIALDQSLFNYAKETQDYSNKYNSIQYIGDIRVADISNLLGKDFKNLATEIGITQSEINTIEKRFPKSIARQAQDMFRIFQEKGQCNINILERALKAIGREDILQKCKITQNQIDDSLPENNAAYSEYERSATIQSLHEREETKYSGEEKEIGESESDDENQKRTVAERREKIVKRLSIERQIPASTQKKEIAQEITEIKRKSLIEDKKAMHEEEIMLQMPTDNIIKSMVPEHMLKLKLSKLDTTEVSKIDFDNELILKFKTTKDRNGTGEQNYDSNETIDNENRFSTNPLIQKSDSHPIDDYSEEKNGVQLEELEKSKKEICDFEMRTVEQAEMSKKTVSSQLYISKYDSDRDFDKLLAENLQTSAAKVILKKYDIESSMSYEKTKDNFGTIEEDKDETCSTTSDQKQPHIDVKTVITVCEGSTYNPQSARNSSQPSTFWGQKKEVEVIEKEATHTFNNTGDQEHQYQKQKSLNVKSIVDQIECKQPNIIVDSLILKHQEKNPNTEIFISGEYKLSKNILFPTNESRRKDVEILADTINHIKCNKSNNSILVPSTNLQSVIENFQENGSNKSQFKTFPCRPDLFNNTFPTITIKEIRKSTLNPTDEASNKILKDSTRIKSNELLNPGLHCKNEEFTFIPITRFPLKSEKSLPVYKNTKTNMPFDFQFSNEIVNFIEEKGMQILNLEMHNNQALLYSTRPIKKTEHKFRKDVTDFSTSCLIKRNTSKALNENSKASEKIFEKIDNMAREAIPFSTKYKHKYRDSDLECIESQIMTSAEETMIKPSKINVLIIGEDQQINLEAIGEDICEIKCVKKTIPINTLGKNFLSQSLNTRLQNKFSNNIHVVTLPYRKLKTFLRKIIPQDLKISNTLFEGEQLTQLKTTIENTTNLSLLKQTFFYQKKKGNETTEVCKTLPMYLFSKHFLFFNKSLKTSTQLTKSFYFPNEIAAFKEKSGKQLDPMNFKEHMLSINKNPSNENINISNTTIQFNQILFNGSLGDSERVFNSKVLKKKVNAENYNCVSKYNSRSQIISDFFTSSSFNERQPQRKQIERYDSLTLYLNKQSKKVNKTTQISLAQPKSDSIVKENIQPLLTFNKGVVISSKGSVGYSYLIQKNNSELVFREQAFDKRNYQFLIPNIYKKKMFQNFKAPQKTTSENKLSTLKTVSRKTSSFVNLNSFKNEKWETCVHRHPEDSTSSEIENGKFNSLNSKKLKFEKIHDNIWKECQFGRTHLDRNSRNAKQITSDISKGCTNVKENKNSISQEKSSCLTNVISIHYPRPLNKLSSSNLGNNTYFTQSLSKLKSTFPLAEKRKVESNAWVTSNEDCGHVFHQDLLKVLNPVFQIKELNFIRKKELNNLECKHFVTNSRNYILRPEGNFRDSLVVDVKNKNSALLHT